MKSSDSEFADFARKRQIVETGGKQHTEELCNPGKKKICFGCGGVEGFSSVKAEDRLERADGALNGSSFCVEPVPFIRIAHDTGIKALIGVRINVNAATVRGICAGRITKATSGNALFRLDSLGLRANEFETLGTVFTGAGTFEKQRRFVLGTERNPVFAQISGF